MRRKLKAKIFEMYGTQEECCRYIKETLGYNLHYSKLSRFINGYLDLNEQEKDLIGQALRVKAKDYETLFTNERND